MADEHEAKEIRPADLDPGVRLIIEALAERFDVGVGQGWLKLAFMDGELLHVVRESKIPGTAVDHRFPAPA